MIEQYGKKIKLSQKQMDIIASYMDDEIRESLHLELAPCEPEIFLVRYLEKCPEFEKLLCSEFGIEVV